MIKTRSGCRYVAYCRILLLQCKPKVGCTKPSTGPHLSPRPRIGQRWYRNRPMCLAIAGAANQSETKSHISYCVIAKRHSMYIVTCTWAHMNIAPALPHSHTYFWWARLILNITHHKHDNNRTLQGVYCNCYACYLVGLLVYNYLKDAWNWAKSRMWLARCRLATAMLFYSVSAQNENELVFECILTCYS